MPSTGCQIITNKSQLNLISDQIVKFLKDKNFIQLADFVGPNGLRFSPYSNVNDKQDVILNKADLLNIFNSKKTYLWGSQDGSGLPIKLTFKDYFAKYVFDLDFSNAPEKYINQKFERGNIINNAWDVYKNGYFVEYYFPEVEKKYSGMDRRSLILVFQKNGGNRYLVGLIHGQRTI